MRRSAWRNGALACACWVGLAPMVALATNTPLPYSGTVQREGDRLAAMLQGEFAFQSGDNRQAASDYLRAAGDSDDPALAQRAAGIALLAFDTDVAARAIARWRQIDPSSSSLAQYQALLALSRDERKQATAYVLGMLDGSDGWQRVVQTLTLANDRAVTSTVAGDVYASHRWPTSVEAMVAFGDAARRLGNLELAAHLADDASARYPHSPQVWLLGAAVRREADDKPAARAAIDRAIAESHGDAKVRGLAADAFGRLGDAKRAAATLARGPQDDGTFASRAAWLAQADDAAGLEALYAEVKALPGTPDSRRGLLLGQLAEYLKHPQQALAWYRGVQDGAAHDDARNRIAIVLESQGDLAGALAVLREQHRAAVASVDAQSASYRIEADLLAKHDRKAEALAAYDRGLAFFDGDSDLLYGRALLLVDMGRIPEAESDLRAMIAADPDNAAALNALGYTLADHTTRYAEAQVLIERALRLQPDSAAFLDSLGWLQHRQGHDDEALRNLSRAFALLKDPEIAAHLGEVLWLRGDKDAARSVWKQGLELDKGNVALQRVERTYHP